LRVFALLHGLCVNDFDDEPAFKKSDGPFRILMTIIPGKPE
jgi:hypothetical protein